MVTAIPPSHQGHFLANMYTKSLPCTKLFIYVRAHTHTHTRTRTHTQQTALKYVYAFISLTVTLCRLHCISHDHTDNLSSITHTIVHIKHRISFGEYSLLAWYLILGYPPNDAIMEIETITSVTKYDYKHEFIKVFLAYEN